MNAVASIPGWTASCWRWSRHSRDTEPAFRLLGGADCLRMKQGRVARLTLVLRSPSQMTDAAADGGGAASGFTTHASGFCGPRSWQGKGRHQYISVSAGAASNFNCGPACLCRLTVCHSWQGALACTHLRTPLPTMTQSSSGRVDSSIPRRQHENLFTQDTELSIEYTAHLHRLSLLQARLVSLALGHR